MNTNDENQSSVANGSSAYENSEKISEKASSVGVQTTDDQQAKDKYQEDGLADHILHGFPLVSCVAAVCLCLMINAMDQTLVLTFLSEVGSEFGDFGKISWVVSGYLLPGAVLSMTWGKLSLIFGRKYCMLIGIAFFFIGSIICALSKNMDMLIGGRVITGIGGGCIQVCVFLIVTEIVPIHLRGMLQGIMGGVFGIASVVAPLLGGALSKVTWRWNFWIALFFTGIGAVALIFFYKPPIPEGTLKEKLKQIDYIGTVLLCAGLVLLLLALTFGSTSKPWNSAIVISFFVVGGVLLVVYFGYNFTICKHPMFPAEVFKVPQVLAPCVAFFFHFGGFLASMVYLATYFQIVWDQSPLKSGISLIPEILALVITSIVVGIAVTKTGQAKPFAVFGSALAAVGMGLLSLLDENTSNSKRIGYLIVVGIGIGSLFQSVAMCAQIAARKKKSEDDKKLSEGALKKASGDAVLIATAALAFARALGGVIGSSLGQTVLSAVFKSQMQGVQLPDGVDPMYLLNSPDAIRQLPDELGNEVIRAFVVGFKKTMYFAMALELAGLVASLFFTNKKVPKSVKQKGPKDEEEAVADGEEKNSNSNA